MESGDLQIYRKTILDRIPKTVSKYVLSGLIATMAMFVTLVFFREVVGLWYLYSSTIAFLVGFTSSFLLQKLWTFGCSSGASTHKQLVLFLVVSLVNLGLNDLGMFVLVDLVGLWYLFSQFFVTVVLAILSFFVYRLIFQDKVQGGAKV